MVHSQVDFRIYLDIYCLMIPPYEGDESLGEFKLIVDDEESLWVVNRLEGGQRLLLSPEATEALLTALLHSRSVTVAIGRYNTELTLHNFECDYDKLCAYPSTGS